MQNKNSKIKFVVLLFKFSAKKAIFYNKLTLIQIHSINDYTMPK